MGKVLRLLRTAALSGLIACGVLVLFLPGNRRAADGPADPLLGVRRPVLDLLRRVGLAPRPTPILGSDPWLPSGFSVATETTAVTIERRPVYRGLLWPIGKRMRWTARGFPEYRRLRLAVLGWDDRDVAAEAGPETPAGGTLAVEAFVPDDARGWRLEGIDAGGVPHEIRSEWRDPE